MKILSMCVQILPIGDTVAATIGADKLVAGMQSLCDLALRTCGGIKAVIVLQDSDDELSRVNATLVVWVVGKLVSVRLFCTDIG